METHFTQLALRTNRVFLRNQEVEIRERPEPWVLIEERDQRWALQDRGLNTDALKRLKDPRQDAEPYLVAPSMAEVHTLKLP